MIEYFAIRGDTKRQIEALLEVMLNPTEKSLLAWRAEIKFKADCIRRKMNRYPAELIEYDEPE